MVLMSLGRRLKLEREACGLTQSAIAAIGGVQPNAQFLYESGMRCPRADYLSRLTVTAIDVLFVVTGRRKQYAVAQLPKDEYALIQFFRTADVSDKYAIEFIIKYISRRLAE
jgi:transcriptional regulator with XRE-family HTH domain